MVNYLSLIDKFYAERPELKALLLRHSRQVADHALAICQAHPDWQVDLTFVEEAAMLHDIGIYRCNAPKIFCMGDEHYIRHGLIGGEILRAEGLPLHARVAERHTGSGLTREQIIAEHLPLPEQNFLPETIAEKVICYADKFFSKSRINKIASSEHIRQQMEQFGNGSLERWDALEQEMNTF